MSETRKLTTILAADVAGYSRLTGTDEEGTIRRLRVLRAELIDPAIQTNRGRVFHTAGDSIMIEFASVVDAVRCSVEVQRGVTVRNGDFVPEKQIEFRVGIHLGDVMVQPDGDLLGDGVNVAARLEGIAEPGGVCLSNAAYDQVRDKLKESFVDLGDRELKNIARPVRVYSLEVGKPAQAKPAPPARQIPAPSTAPRLSIVVLPFANIGGDPEQEYFVDGVTESLTTDLSRISGSFVIARNTAFTYKGKPFDVKQIGRDLNVRYVLEGSVQRAGNRLRVNVQLIDTESGAHLWAERFDKPLADLFDMQDEVVSHLANQLNRQLVDAEVHSLERSKSGNCDSVDLTLRGWSLLWARSLPDARAAFEAALRLDEANVGALIGLAESHASELAAFASTDRERQLQIGEEAIAKALALAPNDARARLVHAFFLRFRVKTGDALRELERAVQLDRNYAQAHSNIGYAKIFLGRSEETEAHIREAIRLSPRDTYLSTFLFAIGAADLYLGKLDRAAEWCRKALDANPKYGLPNFYLAAAIALVGRVDDARTACNNGLRLQPNFTIAKFRLEISGNNPTYLAQRERLYEGMRLAGVPEG